MVNCPKHSFWVALPLTIPLLLLLVLLFPQKQMKTEFKSLEQTLSNNTLATNIAIHSGQMKTEVKSLEQTPSKNTVAANHANSGLPAWRPASQNSNAQIWCPVGMSQPTRLPPRGHLHADKKSTCTTDDLRRGVYYGQTGEDSYAVSTFFSKLTRGTFVELGALDGETYANTKFLEDNLGWMGLLIEANPGLFTPLCSRRRCSERVSAAICDPRQVPNGTLTFIQKRGVPAVGGIYEFMAPVFRTEFYPNPLEEIMQTIMCYPLQHIFDVFDIRHIDFFSLDVEGAELSVLQTVDFQRVQIDVAVIELDGRDAAKDEQVRQLLKRWGFIVHGATKLNTWFVRQGSEYANIPSRLV